MRFSIGDMVVLDKGPSSLFNGIEGIIVDINPIRREPYRIKITKTNNKRELVGLIHIDDYLNFRGEHLKHLYSNICNSCMNGCKSSDPDKDSCVFYEERKI
jgi:hypothetical protein